MISLGVRPGLDLGWRSFDGSVALLTVFDLSLAATASIEGHIANSTGTVVVVGMIVYRKVEVPLCLVDRLDRRWGWHKMVVMAPVSHNLP